MREIYTISEPNKVIFGNTDASNREPAIVVGSPFWGLPTYDELGNDKVNSTKFLLVDLNIINYIRRGKNKNNVHNIFQWAHDEQVIVMPHVALSEQGLSHGNPKQAFSEYIAAMNKDFSFQMPMEEAQKLFTVFSDAAPGARRNTEMMRDYLVIIKHFYHKKKNLKNKVVELCDLIHRQNIPVFAFAVKVACLFFYIKEHPDQFTDKITSKIQSDMEILPDREKEEKKLWNFASDLMLFIAAIELFFNKETEEYCFSYIASADTTVATILSHICYGRIIINEDGNCFGMPAIRPDSDTRNILDPLLTKYLKQSKQYSATLKDSTDPRRENLKSLAERIMTDQKIKSN